MARFLFSTAPFPAHLDWGGLLATARRLRDRGHAVLWASGPEVGGLLDAAGIDRREIPVASPAAAALDLGKVWSPHSPVRAALMAMLWRAALRPSAALRTTPGLGAQYALLVRAMTEMWLQEDAVARACEAHLRLIADWEADVVIAEPMVVAAALAAEASGVAFASCGYPGPYLVVQPIPEVAPAVDEYHQILNRLRRRFDLAAVERRPDPEMFFSSAELQMVFFPPEWFAGASPRPSAGACFLGGVPFEPWTPAPAWLDELPADRSLVVIARASSYHSSAGTLPALFEAVGRIGGYGVIGGSPRVRSALEPLPAHIRWEPWVPYEHLLPRAAAVAHHGGLGTTHAAIRHGVPQLVAPEAGDQLLHAHAVATQGVGVLLHGHPTVAQVETALRHVTGDPRVRSACERARGRFASLGGVTRAAERLVELAERRRPNARLAAAAEGR